MDIVMEKKLTRKAKDQRMQFQLRRILSVYWYIANRRFAVDMDRIHENNFDQWNVSTRTTRRDLQVLELAGLIYREDRCEVVGFRLNRQPAVCIGLKSKNTGIPQLS